MFDILTLTHNGDLYSEFTVSELRKLGVPENAIGAAMKLSALKLVAGFAESYRQRLAPASAGKLAEWSIKAVIAADQTTASETELGLISREAAARGTNRTGLIGQIKAQATAYRQIALLIGVLEAEAGAVITSIADDADDIEVQIQTVLAASQAQAEIAFTEAQVLIGGA